MARSVRLAVAGSLTLLVGLVLLFPARVAYQWFGPDEVRLGTLSGSVWNGSADEASFAGVYLSDVRWAFRPARLLRGALSFAVQASPASGFIEAQVEVGVTGVLTIRELTASLPLELLRGVTRNPGLAGSLSVELDEARLDGRVPVAGQGTFRVANLVVPQLHAASIGGYRGALETQDAGVLLTYEDSDGLIDIEGRIDIQADGNFRHTARLQAKANTPGPLREGIGMMPLASDGSGWREWTFGEGRL